MMLEWIFVMWCVFCRDGDSEHVNTAPLPKHQIHTPPDLLAVR